MRLESVLAFGMIFIPPLLIFARCSKCVCRTGTRNGAQLACAAFVWCGLRISMISFVGIPLMGIGIDMIIHLIHRIGEEGKGRTTLRFEPWKAAICLDNFVILVIVNYEQQRYSIVISWRFLVWFWSVLCLYHGSTGVDVCVEQRRRTNQQRLAS